MSGDGRTRADRLRLSARLALAEHASELLASKEEALERERVRLDGHVTRAHAVWAESYGAAAAALVRARMLGGGEEVARLVRRGARSATVTADWQRSMGITYPGDVTCTAGSRPPLTATAALRPATDAYRRALEAAAGVAAATTAVDRLVAELADTRRRRRAIDDRLRPDLERRRRELDLHLDELDRDEALRVRLALGGRSA